MRDAISRQEVWIAWPSQAKPGRTHSWKVLLGHFSQQKTLAALSSRQGRERERERQGVSERERRERERERVERFAPRFVLNSLKRRKFTHSSDVASAIEMVWEVERWNTKGSHAANRHTGLSGWANPPEIILHLETSKVTERAVRHRK